MTLSTCAMLPHSCRGPWHNQNMAVAELVEWIPLALDADGVYRIGGTRVTLDLVVECFEAGASAEEIV